MKASRFIAGLIAGLSAAMLMAALSLRAYAQDQESAVEAGHTQQDKAKIKAETQEILMGKQKIIQDHQLVKAERAKLRKAKRSGNKDKIAAAEKALQDDIARKKADISELKKNKIQRHRDIIDLKRDLKEEKRETGRH